MSENIKVIVRCRPFSEKESSNGHSCIVQVNTDTACVQIKDTFSSSNNNENVKKFTFDSVFDSDSTQTNLYDLTARPIVESVLNGYNGTIFAYGQTGTGKTFTMSGSNDPPELRGIIPNAIQHIFQHIQGSNGINFLVRASYLEIYNEDIRDLLNPKNNRLDIKERPDIGIYVKDLQSFVIKDASEMDRLMGFGNKNRSVGATLMNERSSRSHSIFTITVEASENDENGNQHIRAGKLHLVDLAGSERQSKTGATGDRLKEATKINLSLSALGNVITALVDGKSTHIPYRDSKLTRLLQDSLGGNAKTLMIATLSPASYNYDESISTLRYANRAKNIKNKPHVNEDPKDTLLRQFQEEIEKLRQQLNELESHNFETNGGKDDYDSENQTESGSAKKLKEKPKGKNNDASLTTPNKLTEQELVELQQKLENEKKEILVSKTLEESEKQEILKQIEQRSKEMAKERQMRQQLSEKLKQLEKQLLMGNVNLLDKEARQREMLAKQAIDFEENKRRERELQRQLEESELAKIKMSENYSNLQEEALAKTKKLKKLWTYVTNARNEIKDLREEHQRERADLLQTIRAIHREIKLCLLVISQMIPAEHQEIIENAAEFDENSETWHIAHIAHAGNNVRSKRSAISNKISSGVVVDASVLKESQMSNYKEIYLDDETWTSSVFPNVFLSYEDAKLSKKIFLSSPLRINLPTSNNIAGTVNGNKAIATMNRNSNSASYFSTTSSPNRTSSHQSPKKSNSSRPSSANSSPNKPLPIPNQSTSSSPKRLDKSEIPVARGLVSKPVRYA